MMEYVGILLSKNLDLATGRVSLNPCYDGIRRDTIIIMAINAIETVLILVMMEYVGIPVYKRTVRVSTEMS